VAIQDEIPKSRLTLRYKTEINGEPQDVSLPMRLLVAGDFSRGTSQDRKADLEERRIRSLDGTNTDAVMKDMGIRLDFAIQNRIDPQQVEELQVRIPIESMKSFSPDEVARNVPKVRGLLTLKKLLEEMLSNVDNRKEFRRLLNDLMANDQALAKVLGELKGFDGLKLPAGKE